MFEPVCIHLRIRVVAFSAIESGTRDSPRDRKALVLDFFQRLAALCEGMIQDIRFQEVLTINTTTMISTANARSLNRATVPRTTEGGLCNDDPGGSQKVAVFGNLSK